MFFVFSGVAVIPVEPRDFPKVNHVCILSSCTFFIQHSDPDVLAQSAGRSGFPHRTRLSSLPHPRQPSPLRRARPRASRVSRMRGRPFFHGLMPLKPASMAGGGSGAGLAASSWATARTCSGRVNGNGGRWPGRLKGCGLRFRSFYSQIGLLPAWIGHSLLLIKERFRPVMGIGFASDCAMLQ